MKYKVRPVIHLAAQTIVGIANRNPISTLETNIGGHQPAADSGKLDECSVHVGYVLEEGEVICKGFTNER